MDLHGKLTLVIGLGESGLAMAQALERLAEDLRCDRAAAAEAAVRRASVLAVLPLGLCFLPAFLLTGVVPVVVSILAGVGQDPAP